MNLPSAEEVRAVLTAARDCGVTRLKITLGPNPVFEAEMAPTSDGERILEKINRAAPLDDDPLAIVRREVAAGNKMPARDLLDLIANGTRVVPVGSGDPTQPE